MWNNIFMFMVTWTTLFFAPPCSFVFYQSIVNFPKGHMLNSVWLWQTSWLVNRNSTENFVENVCYLYVFNGCLIDNHISFSIFHQDLTKIWHHRDLINVLAFRKLTYDKPETERPGTTHTDNASNQISN